MSSANFNVDINMVFAILNGRVSSSINKSLATEFKTAGIDLTPEGWTVMIFLWEKDGVSQQALCNATYRDKPGMTRLLDTLEKKHLVVRVTDRSDKRSKLIFLTNEGRQIEAQARAATQRMLSNALKGLDADELIISQEVLKQVFKNLSD